MKSPLSVLVLACVAFGAHAQTKMYKCTGDGRTVYQQTACASAAGASAPSDNAATTGRSGDGKSTAQATKAPASGSIASSSRPGAADTVGRLAPARP